MSSGDARYSQSAISVIAIKKQGETSTQRSTKRPREDAKHLSPEILISNSSTLTIVQEKDSVNSNSLTTASQQNHYQDELAIKPNHLNKKITKIQLTQIFCQKV